VHVNSATKSFSLTSLLKSGEKMFWNQKKKAGVLRGGSRGVPQVPGPDFSGRSEILEISRYIYTKIKNI